jgi:DNA-binding CsgD family transcriptional regulator/PAS domain-containing protein
MHLDERLVQDLIGAIYEGATDPVSLQDALVRLSDVTRSVGAMFISMDRVRPEQSRYALGRLDPELMRIFLASHAFDSPWAQAADRMSPGTTVSIDAIVPAAELRKTDFYGEILQPQRILHCGCAPLARDAERVMGVSVFRAPKIGPVDTEDLRLLSLVAPHFKRAAQIAWRLGAIAALEEAKTAALDRLDHGVLVVDAGARVLFANRPAEEMIGLRDGLTVTVEGIKAALAADTARLRKLVAETIGGSAGGTMRVSRPSLAEPFLMLVAPARGNGYLPIDPAKVALIFVTSPDRMAEPDLHLLAQAFGLTATEARIAVTIAAGGGVPAAARALRISPNTVHTHLRRVLRKLGVNDQAALVRVLMRTIGVLPANRQDGNEDIKANASARSPHKT